MGKPPIFMSAPAPGYQLLNESYSSASIKAPMPDFPNRAVISVVNIIKLKAAQPFHLLVAQDIHSARQPHDPTKPKKIASVGL